MWVSFGKHFHIRHTSKTDCSYWNHLLLLLTQFSQNFELNTVLGLSTFVFINQNTKCQCLILITSEYITAAIWTDQSEEGRH